MILRRWLVFLISLQTFGKEVVTFTHWTASSYLFHPHILVFFTDVANWLLMIHNCMFWQFPCTNPQQPVFLTRKDKCLGNILCMLLIKILIVTPILQYVTCLSYIISLRTPSIFSSRTTDFGRTSISLWGNKSRPWLNLLKW